MRQLLLIAAAELRLRSRDKSVWVVAIVAPALLLVVSTFALGGLNRPLHAHVAVVGEHADVTALSTTIGELGFAAALTLEPVGTIEAAERRVASGDADAALVVSAAAQELRVVPPARPTTGTLVVEQLAAEISRRGAATPPGGAVGTAGVPGSTTSDTVVGGRRVTIASRLAPALWVLFAFFIVGLGAKSLVLDSANGTVDRTLLGGATVAQVVVGKALAAAALAFGSAVTMWVISVAVFRVSWGSVWGVSALVAATVVAMMGVTSLVAGAVRSANQADGLTSLVAFGCAIVSGNIVPLARLSPTMRTFGMFTPNGLALRGFSELLTDGKAVGIALAVAALAAVGLVSGGVGLVAVRHRYA